MLTTIRASRRQFLCGLGASPAAAAVGVHPAVLAMAAVERSSDADFYKLLKVCVACGLGEFDRVALLSAASLFPQLFDNFELRLRDSASAACWALRDFGEGVAIVDCQTFVDAGGADSSLVSVAQLSCGWPYLVAFRQDDKIRAVNELSGATLLVNGQRERRAFTELANRFGIHHVRLVGVVHSAEHDLAAGRSDAILVSELHKAEFIDKGYAFRYLRVPYLANYPRNCLVAPKQSLRNEDFVAALKKLLLALKVATAFVEEQPAAAVRVVAARFADEIPPRRDLLLDALIDVLDHGSHRTRSRTGFGIHSAEEWTSLQTNYCDRISSDPLTTNLYVRALNRRLAYATRRCFRNNVAPAIA